MLIILQLLPLCTAFPEWVEMAVCVLRPGTGPDPSVMTMWFCHKRASALQFLALGGWCLPAGFGGVGGAGWGGGPGEDLAREGVVQKDRETSLGRGLYLAP